MTWNQMRNQMRNPVRCLIAALMAVAVLGTHQAVVHAQDFGASAGAEGEADPESGFVGGATWEDSSSSSGTSEAPAQSYEAPSSSSDPRLGLQVRIDAVNVLGIGDLVGPEMGQGIGRVSVPIVTPGVRLADGQLFLGLGFGFDGYSQDDGTTETSNSAFSFSPLATFDLLSDRHAALYLGGWLNLVPVGDTEVCVDGTCAEGDDGGFGWGLDLVAGLRGIISPGLAIGGEFGWGFLNVSRGDTDVFGHGVVGTLLLEASVGI